MTTHIVSGYVGGFTLAGGDYLTVTSAGVIGGNGLTAGTGSTTVNSGVILSRNASGGLNGVGYQNGNYYSVGAGGSAGHTAHAAAIINSATITDDNLIQAGNGGHGGAGATSAPAGSFANLAHVGGVGGAGGAGGVGVTLTNSAMISGTASYLSNTYGGVGGAGGNGGEGDNNAGVGFGGEGGAGGASGITMALTGSQLSNSAYVGYHRLYSMAGGAGGVGGSSVADYAYGGKGGAAGAGGAGVSASSSTITNHGDITGAPGGVGGNGGAANGVTEARGGDGGVGGVGGTGIVLVLSTLMNAGFVFGGRGGKGGHGGDASGGAIVFGNGGNGGYGGAAIVLDGGLVDNSFTIAGASGGAGGASLRLAGSIGKAGDGVDVTGGGTIVNRAAGYIYGYDGVKATAAGATVINYGTIKGTYDAAVDFTMPGDVLIAKPGSKFVGVVDGGGGTLVVAGATGSITSLGDFGSMSGAITATFAQFGAYEIVGHWTVGGGSLSATQTLTIDAASLVTVRAATLFNHGTIDMAASGAMIGASGGVLVNDLTILGGGTLKGLALTNAAGAVIDADNGHMVINQLGGALSNRGLILSAGSGVLTLADTEVVNLGAGAIDDAHSLQLSTATILGGGLTVESGSVLTTSGGGAAIDLQGGTVSNAGLIEVGKAGLSLEGPVSNTGYLEAINGTLTVSGAVTGAGRMKLVGSGVIELDGSSAESAYFTGGSTGRLALGDTSGFTGLIYGLSTTGANAIDLVDRTYDALDTVSYRGAAAGGTLTVRNGDGATIAALKLRGAYTTSSFVLSDDGAGHILIKDTPAAQASPLISAMAGFSAGSAAQTIHPAIALAGRDHLLAGPAHFA
jgi:hypothetical protein